jgi:hypothetical protein
LTVKVEDAEPPADGVTEAGLREAPHPAGTLVAKFTTSLNPLREVTVIVEVGEAPRLAVIEDGDADIEKSGVVTGA